MIDVSAWSGLRLVHAVDDGNRNEVWRGELVGEAVAVRRSNRSGPSLEWELDLHGFLTANGFHIPSVIAADDGRRSVDGVVVQQWITGEPPADDLGWARVAAELQRLHGLTGHYPQRPTCCTVTELAQQRTSVDADLDVMAADAVDRVSSIFARFVDVPTAVVHGDPGPSNLRISADGRVGMLDWDESRVDVTWHDLSSLGVRVLSPADHAAAEQLSHAWEAANGWVAEPDYARRRLAALDR